ncbi:MAG: ABC transporter ATP-binding protein [Streptosporangiales bacterium]
MRLQARDLVAGYGRLSVLHHIDLRVDDGELVAVLGPNGAGKSTLVKTLARVLRVTSGDLELDGRSITRWRASDAAAAGIGFVPQEGNVFANLSVQENLALSQRKTADSGLLDAVYERFPVLRDRGRQAAGSLSGGERQSLAVAMAFVASPSLLLLDEPTTGLAPMASQALTNWIVEIAAAGTTVVWVVEQNPEPVLAAAHRAYVLDGGEVRFEGAARDLSGSDVMELVFAQGDQGHPAPQS